MARESRSISLSENTAVISIIGPGTTVTGEVVTDGTLRVEGTILGNVRAAKAVVIGQTGRVVGEVQTEDAVLGGVVEGTIIAASRLELQGTARITATIRVHPRRFVVEEGAEIRGEIAPLDGERVSDGF